MARAVVALAVVALCRAATHVAVDFSSDSADVLKHACGPPTRFSPGLRKRLWFFAFVSDDDPFLLAHFLDFYAARGLDLRTPGRARLVVHAASGEGSAAAVAATARVGSGNVRYAGSYTSHLKRDSVNAFLRTLPDDALLMYPDLDEFFDAPPESVEASVRDFAGFSRGVMVERIAADWTLAPVLEAAPPWVTFPRRCAATTPLFKGNSEKYVVVPATVDGVRVRFDGSHSAVPAAPAATPYLAFSHYRFDARAHATLVRKRAAYASRSGGEASGHEAAHAAFYDSVLAFIDAAAEPAAFTDAFRETITCGATCDP